MSVLLFKYVKIPKVTAPKKLGLGSQNQRMAFSLGHF
jgi:hypothetical protein